MENNNNRNLDTHQDDESKDKKHNTPIKNNNFKPRNGSAVPSHNPNPNHNPNHNPNQKSAPRPDYVNTASPDDANLPPVHVFALGGLGEVGKNMYCVEMGNELWIIDSGIKFANDLPTVEGIIPSFEYLIKNQKKIRGLIITHGHEDHIGSIPNLCAQVKIPRIFAGKMALNQIYKKLREKGVGKVNGIIVNNKFVFKTRNFNISFFNVNHSIPDAFGIAFKTKHGTIVTTGDFKFDLTPVGTSADVFKMGKLGAEGVDLLLSDSTNAGDARWSRSEMEVRFALDKLMTETKGRVLIATFSSNVYRVREIIKASIKHKRKIVTLGWSMNKNVEIARQIKYINVSADWFIEPNEMKDYKDDELTIICTGTQGEPNAAIAKMVGERLKEIKLKKEDTVVFASSVIPGNFESVEKIKNSLYKKGLTLIDNDNTPNIHASGHAGSAEALLMLTLLKPKYLFPIHGEYVMLVKHGLTAEKTGIPKKNIFILNNGGRLKLERGVVEFVGTVPAGNVYIDDSSLSGQSQAILSERIQMSTDGIITLSLKINAEKKEMLGNVGIQTRGFVNMSSEKGKETIEEITKGITSKFEEMKSGNEKLTSNKLKEMMNEVATFVIMEKFKLAPIVVSVILSSTNLSNDGQ